jgi:hypothetical protein
LRSAAFFPVALYSRVSYIISHLRIRILAPYSGFQDQWLEGGLVLEIRGKGAGALSGLPDRLRDAARARHHGTRTALAHARRVSDFVRHCGIRQPSGMGGAETAAFPGRIFTRILNRGGIGKKSPAAGLPRGVGA